MFKDTEEELKRLEAELLADDDLDDEFEEDLDKEYRDWEEDWEEEAVLSQDTQVLVFPGKLNICNADRESPEELSEELLDESRSGKGLGVFACILGLGILGIVIFWILRYLGGI